MSSKWPLGWQDLWDPRFIPFELDHFGEATRPWELLQGEKLKALIHEAQGQKGMQRIGLRGLLTQSWILHQGRTTPFEEDQDEVSGLEGITKGQLQVLRRGTRLEGASFLEAGCTIGRQSDIFIGEGCLIQSGAYLDGPSVVGHQAEIRQGAFVRGGVLMGRQSLVGHASEIKNSILFQGAKAPHFAYVGDSILGAECNLGAGTKVSNLKITHDEIVISANGERFGTGMRKLGAILGDHVEVGCNAVLNPGVVLGRHSMVYPAIAVRSGVYWPKSLIKDGKKVTTHGK